VATFQFTEKESTMAKQSPRSYPPEFRRKIIDLARAARGLSELSREFTVSRQTIVNWVKQDDLDVGRRDDGLTTSERQELTRLRRENKRLTMETEILKKAAAWFARETNLIPEKSSD
jgi:transposase